MVRQKHEVRQTWTSGAQPRALMPTELSNVRRFEHLESLGILISTSIRQPQTFPGEVRLHTCHGRTRSVTCLKVDDRFIFV